MPGNPSGYNRLDVIRCFLLLKEQRSRGYLPSELALGEGSVRGILELLIEQKLIIPTNKGHIQSGKGKKEQQCLEQEVRIFPQRVDKQFLMAFFPLYITDTIACAQVLSHIKGIEKTYVLRDTAVRSGADGCLILASRGKRLSFFEENRPFDLSPIGKLFPFRDDVNDGVVIVTIGTTRDIALKSCLAVIDVIGDAFQFIRHE